MNNEIISYAVIGVTMGSLLATVVALGVFLKPKKKNAVPSGTTKRSESIIASHR